MRIFRFESVESTNDTAREERFSHADIVVAQAQSAGRGQRGNKWDSCVGENLTFSMVLEPSFLPADKQFLLLQVVALGISDMLKWYGIDAKIKWTNDIYVGDKKIAGVLIENDICGMNLSRSIVGIGINVNQTIFGRHLPNPTSMALITPDEFDLNQVLNRVAEAIMCRYEQLEQGNSETLIEEYISRLYLLGIKSRYALPDGEEFDGIIRSVDACGELSVEHPDGKVQGYLFKEIEFILGF